MNIRAANYATTTAIVLITVMTIVGELWAGFKSFLGSITGHHWITKGLLALVVFIVLYLVLSKLKETENTARGTVWSFSTAIVGGVAIFVFYLIHYSA